jgi:hypothetical protein
MKHVNLTFLIIVLISFNAIAQKKYDLKTITVSATRNPDTVFGTWKFSVEDYDFYQDKLILLTFKKSLEHPTIMLADATKKILSSFNLPDEAESLYHDFQGFTNVICKEHIYRIKIVNDVIHIASLPDEDYRNEIMPCIDTIEKYIYFSNYSRGYPEFTYYAYNTTDCKASAFKTVTDNEQLQGFNMEYYFLQPKERLQCMKLADEYHVDKHKVAAMMSGLTTSMYYTPLYAPLFVVRDTVCVFDHYNNAILKYNKSLQRIDSIPINYHHPKSWRDWKHKLIADKETNKVYALYQKNGYCQLKQIDIYSGKIINSFKLTYPYVKNIKIKNDYVYYVYSPFESMQEQFIYKELISYNRGLE